jgi:hypothetical protein
MATAYEVPILLVLFAGVALCVFVAIIVFAVRSQNAGVRKPGNPQDPGLVGTSPLWTGSAAGSSDPPALPASDASSAVHGHGGFLDSSTGYAPDSGGFTHGGCDSSFSGGDSGGGGGGGGD